jgi:dihydrofolate reductase
MRKLVLLAHISLDGFVAGPNGELDAFPHGEENLQFVCHLTGDADAALFGRISYKLLNDYWPAARNHPGATRPEIAYSNWYNDAHKIVVSKTMKNENRNNTTILSENILGEIKKIKEQAGRNILIFGSPSVSQLLMQHSLIDDYWIFVNPVVFGKGIPLFTELNKAKFKLLKQNSFPMEKLHAIIGQNKRVFAFWLPS